MKFAVFTVSLPEWTPRQAARVLAAQGWDGIEWRVVDQDDSVSGNGFWEGNRCTWPASTFSTDVREIKELTADAGLTMPSLGTYVPSSDLASVDRLMGVAAELGVPRMRVLLRSVDGGGYQTAFDASRRDFETVAALAARHGVRALVELHPQSVVSSASAARRFLDGLDPENVGVIHDVGNLLYEGFEHLPWSLEILGPYLAHVHVKNAVLDMVERTAEDAQWRWRAAPMRSGAADLRGFFRALTESNYTGWVTVEDFSTEVPLEQRTADNLAYVRALAAEASMHASGETK